MTTPTSFRPWLLSHYDSSVELWQRRRMGFKVENIYYLALDRKHLL